MGMFIKFTDDPECNWCGHKLYACTCSIKKPVTIDTPQSLHNWAITYNAHVKKWRAAKKENVEHLFKPYKSSRIISALTIEELLKQIK